MITFLLSAGEGRRLRPFTEKNIKPSLPLLNLPLLYYGFYLAKNAGTNEFLINKHHLPDQVDQLASSLKSLANNIQTVDETRKLLGSGGALWNAKSILKKYEHFIVANGDEVLIPEDQNVLSQLISKHMRSKALCTLLTCDHSDLLKTLKPVWVNQNGLVVAFGMSPPSPLLAPVHYTGYKVFSRKIFDYLPEGESNIFYEVLTDALKMGEPVETLHLPKCIWHETGSFQSFLQASKSLVETSIEQINMRLSFFGRRPLQVLNRNRGILVAPDSFRPKDDLIIKGFVCLGENVSVGKNVHLKNTCINSNVQLPDNSSFEDQIIMEL